MNDDVTPNGQHVTWRELHLSLDPIRSDVAEMRDDVKTLLARQSEIAGAVRARDAAQDSRRFWTGIVGSLFTAVLAAVIGAALYLAFS